MSSTFSEARIRRLPALFAGATGLVVLIGFLAWRYQLAHGLVITGMSRDVTWGLYISQFTFLVGVAASAVMVVIPYYLHDFKAFSRLLLLGESLAVAAVVAAGLFVFVDLGQPVRVMNVLLHPSLRSPMFWDMLALGGYLAINLVLGITALFTQRYELAAPRWYKPLVLLSIPWAISIHTVTAFLYAGLPGRPQWETAVLAPRFLASAFASGPALLILLCLALRRMPLLDVGQDALRALSRIVAYGLSASLFFLLVELFTALYGHRPEHAEALRVLYLDPAGNLQLWSWGSVGACMCALLLLVWPRTARQNRWIGIAAVLAFFGIWMEKGMGLVVGGFEPSPLGRIAGYSPTFPETLITLGVWAAGVLVLFGSVWLVQSVREVHGSALDGKA
jgi:Ni/Fe-hydrogenase subunit HybB-like protein